MDGFERLRVTRPCELLRVGLCPRLRATFALDVEILVGERVAERYNSVLMAMLLHALRDDRVCQFKSVLVGLEIAEAQPVHLQDLRPSGGGSAAYDICVYMASYFKHV